MVDAPQDRKPGSLPADVLAPARILIVDDDPASARPVVEAVAELGHEVELATNWTDAVRGFGDAVDLVLMDAVMPMVDGFKLTRVLRERAQSYTPILFLTGLDDVASKQRGMSVGADDFLSKPVDPMELRVRLAAMLRIRRLTQALEAERRGYARLAHVDELTGVPNRRSYDERLAVELEQARSSGRPLSLLLVDIDHFKQINDTLGHAVGDEVLAFTGALLRELTRREDLVFRYGGEEFAVLARDTERERARVLAERVRAAFETRSASTSAGRRSCSLGLATYDPDSGEAPDGARLFARADAKLYEAKQSGRNRVGS